jgi:DNA-binding CsgD family transcriptional regulator/tetratricopeptide (TPR) repeat protein
LAHLLSTSQPPGVTSLDVLSQTSRALAEEAEGHRLALCVDDAHLLDAASAALVHQLAVGATASLLVTVRIGEPAPDPIVALWKDRVAERVDLQPLSDAEVSRLLEEVLGSHIDGRTVRQLTRAISGNVLFLHELILSGLSSGFLSNAAGVWRWAGSVVPGVGLSELVEERLSKLKIAERRLLEALALSEPLEAEILQRLAPAEVIREVEESGLMRVVESAGQLTVRITQPLYAEVLRKTIPRLQARATLRQLADSLEATQSGQPDDLLRLAVLRMRAGQQIASQIAILAAHRALVLGDYGLVEQLISAAQGDAGFPARMLLGQALVGQHREEDAEQMLSSVVAGSDAEVAQLVLLRAVNLVYRLGRLEEAEEVLQEAERTLGDVEFQQVITATRALILATGSSASTGLSLARKVIEQRDTGPLTLARAYVAAGYALSFSGQAEEALQLLDGAHERLDNLEEFASDLWQLLLGARWGALWHAGRWPEAEELAWAEYRAALEEDREADRGYWACLLGTGALFAGHVRTAGDRLREAIAICRTADPHYTLVPALMALAQTAALGGDLKSAQDAISQAEGLPGARLAPMRGWMALSRAWMTAGAGELAAARTLAAEAAEICREAGHFGLEAMALQDVARFGDPVSVSSRLQEIAADSDGLLLPTRARHVSALRSHDGVILGQVAETLAAMGATLLAAEAAMQAAVAHRESGKMASLRTWQLRARELLNACEGARPPALPHLDLPEVLTSREREVAGLAARGLTSPEISKRLTISVRTVENHLQQVFSKLEVRSRQELASVFSSPGSSE